jgi:chromate transporter
MPPLAEVARVFLKLGLTSFGGPVAHLGYFHGEIVRRRRWLDEADYADLVALCQFLPGPASSQLAFALGQRRAGLPGALLASACFTLPSALLMIAFGYGMAAGTGLRGAGWLHGLKLAAVAVVAQAVWVMGRKLCPDLPRLCLALLAAAAVVLLPHAATQVGVIAAGAAAGWWLYRREPRPETPPAAGSIARQHVWAALALAVFGLLLVVLPVAATATGNKPLLVFDSFYRAGALVFGGGHVILPLLRAEVVPVGWISDDRFLAGYGFAQAVPGPLFTFAAYLGTVIMAGPHAWLGGLGCLLAIFLPAWLLIGGTLPFWNLLRHKAGVQTALRGANAAVVGVLLAALYHPVWQEGVTTLRDVAVLLVAFALLQVWRLPAWAVVLATAAAGYWTL